MIARVLYFVEAVGIWFLIILFACALALCCQAGIVADRYPHAFVKVTSTGRLIRSETAWAGHVKSIADVKETSGATWYLVEPSWSLPPSVVPSTNNFVRRIILNGVTNQGVWFQGRTITLP